MPKTDKISPNLVTPMKIEKFDGKGPRATSKECIGRNKDSFCDVKVSSSVTSKKLPNGYTSCLKMISLEKLKIFTPLQKLPKNVGNLAN